MTRADLFLFPSVYDTNGIVVREAAACGLASVLIKGSCAAEGVTHDRNGYLIEENAESMASLLEEACKDLPHLHDVGQHAMDEIYISWEDSVKVAHDRYAELYELSKAGEFGHRKHQSLEYLNKSAAVILEETDRVFKAPKLFYEGMKENFETILEDFEDIRRDIREDIEQVREKFNGNSEE